LMGLHIGFSWRAQLYNHNTVLILFSAATVWATMRALDSNQKRAWGAWMLAGVMAGLAMLSKYQALVPLTGIVIALYAGGYFKQTRVRRGAALAVATALVVFAPHLVWIANGSGTTIDNALHAAEGLGALERLKSLLKFVLVQIRFHAPILMVIALLVLLKPSIRVRTMASMSLKPTLTQQNRAWLLGLIVWPALFVGFVTLTGGVRLQAQWGLQTFQFLMIFIGWRLAVALPQRSMGQAASVVVIAQLALAGFFAWSITVPSQKIWQGERTRNFPAVSMAKEISNKWSQASKCPFRYVVGPSFDATVVSAYSDQHPIVLEDGDFRKEPWVTSDLLKEHGALYLAATASALPAEIKAQGIVNVPESKNDYQEARQIFWGLVLPDKSCS
jgi:Dolichyl-phosphate-mannose-protein mannosyltransferase